MENKVLLLEQSYCSNHIKNARLQTKILTLEVPIDGSIAADNICRFKLIIEEVKDENQLILGSAVLGEKIAEEIYENVSFVEDDFIYYTHENDLKSLVKRGSEIVQQSVENGLLDEITSYKKDAIKLKGEYDIKIQLFRQGIRQPDFLSAESPQYFTDYEQKIEMITVYALVYRKSIDIALNNELLNTSVYGSLGNLGFFMIDLQLFSEFIKKEVGNETINLVDLFTTTDLVDKCFEEGILIITWGIKPWHYYIQRMNSSIIYDECIVSGSYKIKREIKELSVIPGDELLTWPACLEKKWPIIQLEGPGEKVNLSLCTWSGALGNELVPMYILQRSEEYVTDVQPIINYSFF